MPDQPAQPAIDRDQNLHILCVGGHQTWAYHIIDPDGKVTKQELLKGDQGIPGPQGPGAISFATTVAKDGQDHQLAHVDGITISGKCNISIVAVSLDSGNAAANLFISGNDAADGVLAHIDDATPSETWGAHVNTDLDVIAANTTVGKYTRIDVGSYNGPTACNFWGLAIPPSN